MIYPDVAGTVGQTPMVELRRLTEGLPGRVAAKLEMRNPCGSVKDRLGVALIEDAESRGVLRPGMTIIEATGGNTGIGIAFAATIRGYRVVLTMPDTMLSCPTTTCATSSRTAVSASRGSVTLSLTSAAASLARRFRGPPAKPAAQPGDRAGQPLQVIPAVKWPVEQRHGQTL